MAVNMKGVNERGNKVKAPTCGASTHELRYRFEWAMGNGVGDNGVGVAGTAKTTGAALTGVRGMREKAGRRSK